MRPTDRTKLQDDLKLNTKSNATIGSDVSFVTRYRDISGPPFNSS